MKSIELGANNYIRIYDLGKLLYLETFLNKLSLHNDKFRWPTTFYLGR